MKLTLKLSPSMETTLQFDVAKTNPAPGSLFNRANSPK